jgi:plastocyanin
MLKPAEQAATHKFRVGQKVDLTFRQESGHNVLVDVDYA